jgi:crossover junction endodeoxyribonuclease RuvC
VLGVDPGLAATGLGVIGPGPRGIVVIETGVVDTDHGMSLEARVQVVYEGVARAIETHAPALLVLEDLYAEYRFPRTALLMAHARGVVCLAAHQRHVSVLALAPGEVKRAIAGHGAASKAQIQHGIQRLLGLPALPRPSHIADALALAFTGYSRTGGRLA